MILKLGNKKPLVTFLIFSIICFLLIFFMIVPTIRKVYQQKDSLEETKLIFKRDQENVDKYKEDLDYLKKNYSFDQNLAVNENNRVELIEALERIAETEKLKLEIVTQSSSLDNKNNKNKEGSEKVNKIVLKLSLTGDYKDFLVFLYKLQNFKYAINIDKLSLEKFDDSEIKNLSGEDSIENLPEIQGEINISFKQ